MPTRRKKQFIDKKKSVTFQLVHRSQKDPLAADEDAPQRVLVPIQETFHKELQKYDEAELPEIRWSEQKAHGIDFEDDYNYLQHLKEKETEKDHIPIWVDKDDGFELFEDDNDGEELSLNNEGGFMDVEECIKTSEGVKMLSMMFGSRKAEEEDIGMLHRAIPPVGPQPTWDPDVVAGMDEDFDYNDPDNILDDDFVVLANDMQRGVDFRDETKCTVGEDGYEDVDSCSIASYFSDDDNFSEEETKSRFTSYSMTSSVIRRNEHLSHLDDRFEKFFEGYDDDQIGDLSQVEIEGSYKCHTIDDTKGMKMLLGIIDEEDEEKARLECNGLDESDVKKLKENLANRYIYEKDEPNNNNEMTEITKKEPQVKWDCESIISTYSTLYNHPKMIQDAPLKKKKSDRARNDDSVSLIEEPEIAKKDVDKTIFIRNKKETKEEKQLRKQKVKEAKKERRQEKKATKTAFKVEESRQSKQLLNLQQNLNGIRIS